MRLRNTRLSIAVAAAAFVMFGRSRSSSTRFAFTDVRQGAVQG